MSKLSTNHEDSQGRTVKWKKQTYSLNTLKDNGIRKKEGKQL